MWYLVFMTLVNAVVHQQEVQNVYRFSIGIAQIGIIDCVMALGVMIAFMRGGAIHAQFPVIRTHPVLFWILGPMFFGTLFGLTGGLLNGNHMKWFLSSGREFVALALCVLVGYRLVGTPRQVRIMTHVTLWAGVLTATMIFFDFGGNTEKASLTGSLNPMRQIISNWYGEYAPVTALVLIFVIMTRFPLWPTWVSVPIGLYCYIGYAATLSRVGFLILFFGTASSYMLLPKGERVRKFLRSLVFIPILFFACWGALAVSDMIIGRNFSGKVLKHIESLLPGEREGGRPKAWDSRLGGIMSELGIWIQNPLIGKGFGVGETRYLEGKTLSGSDSIKHNGWTSNLAETGVLGTTGLAVLIGSMILLGYRMVHDRTDPTSVLAGALGFFTGFVFLLRFSCTLAMSSRNAIGVGLVCGLLIRAREIQQTQIAMASQDEMYDPYVDPESGLLVPEYAYSNSGTF